MRRPLSVGEIFDRALTAYLRDWPRFSVLALLLSLPGSVVSYAVSSAALQNFGAPGPRGTAPTLGQLESVMLGTPGHPNFQVLWISGLCSALLALVVYPAFLRGLKLGTERQASSLFEWLAPGLRLFRRLLLVCATWFVIALAGYFTFVSALSPVVILGPIALVLVLCVFVLALVMALALSTAFTWSLYIATDEDRHALASVRQALARSMRRDRFWRTTGIAAALVGLSLIIGEALEAAFSYAFFLTRSAWLYVFFSTLVSVPLVAYSALVVSVYFLDSRLRDSATEQQSAG